MTKNTKLTLPWLKPNLALDEAVTRLITSRNTTSKSPKYKLTRQETSALQREFKDAQQAQSNSMKFLRAIGEAIGVKNIHTSTWQAPMKAWDRAVEKKKADRSTRDIGRGRLYIKSLDRYEKFIKLVRSMDDDGVLAGISVKGVTIIPGSVSDYLATARESGFAGMVNFDCKVDLGKSRHGKFEAQIMPRDYEEVDKHSHRLFELIRTYQDIPDPFMTPEDERTRDALILANHVLYIEHGIRSGFIRARKDKWRVNLTSEIATETSEVLDRIRTQIESLDGRNLAWRRETAEAMTYAKTSLHQIAQLPRNYRVEPLQLNR